MTDEQETRWRSIDAELEQLRKDADADLQRMIELVARRGDALERRELLVELHITVLRNQQIIMTLLRNLQWELRLMQRQQAP